MRNYTLGSLWGIPIRLNVSLVVFLPILAWLLGSGAQIAIYVDIINSFWPGSLAADAFEPGARSWTIGIAGALGLFVSVAIHELGHAWAAGRYGIETESITLWLLGGLASLSEMPKEWNRELWIALAGPATSIALAGVFITGLQVTPASQPVLVFILGFLAFTNLLLAAFNMLPAFPMDGGRVLRALLARKRSYASATRIAGRVGAMFAILFAVVGVLAFSPILLLLALFVYGAATSESRAVILDELLAGLSVGDLATTDPAVDADETADVLLSRLLGSRRTDLLVGTDGAIAGVVTAETLKNLDPAAYEQTPVRDLLGEDLPRLTRDLSAFDGLMALASARADVALVETEAGELAGSVSMSDFNSVLDLRRGTKAYGV